MKPPPFEYFAPATVGEALALLGSYEDEAKVLAGGQSLMPLLNMRLARPAALVDINRIPGLDFIRAEDSTVVVGATVTERQLERSRLIVERLPFLLDVVKLIGHPQIRNRGTVCGSIAHADPAAELPAAAVALDAQVTVARAGRSRDIAADHFYEGYLATAIEPGEMLTEVRFPIPAQGSGWSVQEVARRHGDFAVAGAMALLSVEDGRIGSARVVSFGTGGRPTRFPEVEEMLAGAAPSEALFERAAEAVEKLVEPDDDVHASAEYRRHVAGVLAHRALAEALVRARGGSL